MRKNHYTPATQPPAVQKIGRFRSGPTLLLAEVIALALLNLTLPNARAQFGPPDMLLSNTQVFEGDAGVTLLRFPVRFFGAQTLPVAGLAAVAPFSGFGHVPATGGPACGGNVDFRQVLIPFSFPANAPADLLFIDVQVCGDIRIEADEAVALTLVTASNALINTGDGAAGIGIITDDDGPPGITINDISVSTFDSVSKTVNFRVFLHHTSDTPVTVQYATRDGSAHALQPGPPTFPVVVPAYIGTRGTLTIPAHQLSATISVTILGTDGGSFSMNLSNPTGGTLEDDRGVGSITVRPFPTPSLPLVGIFDFATAQLETVAGAIANYTVTWTVPPGEKWRDLNTMDLRLRKGSQTALWVTWDEPSNLFSGCQSIAKKSKKGADEAICGPGLLPGKIGTIDGPEASLSLAETTVLGSGPAGDNVTINFAVRFDEKASGNYTLELGATDDAGHADDFVEAARIHVKKK